MHVSRRDTRVAPEICAVSAYLTKNVVPTFRPLHEATQAQIAAAQEARKLREQAQAAEDVQMLGAAGSTAAERR